MKRKGLCPYTRTHKRACMHVKKKKTINLTINHISKSNARMCSTGILIHFDHSLAYSDQ